MHGNVASASTLDPRAPVRVVIVTLDNHLKGAVDRAEEALAAEGIDLSLHAASEWGSDAGELDHCKAAIAEADTLLLTVPNQLGVDYNAHVIESVLKHIAPALGWR